ncbi:ABC transporter permease [Treponema brennaborense]|uniref:ABC transporter permease protein n=1 Tax=Treponema brennaborense (strain DSM 12168 / CIP 105900 / DD5/3) TaxID=906968 RepID=F4LKM8_TREBD|nr:ABC-2 family transporter protein [Treponema brennaborense]AEE17584.1 protein of unknown function DUF990 [Treponema brennaborense DSM 12168]
MNPVLKPAATVHPLKKLGTYLPFTRNAIQTLLSYRTNVLFFIIGNVVRIFVFFFLWKAVFASSGRTELHGFTFAQMAVYVILTTVVGEISGSVGSDMSDEIRSGQIALSLIKPISFRLRIYFTSLGDTLYCLLMSGVPGMIAAYAITASYGVPGELSVRTLPLFFASLALSVVLRMSYNFIFSLLGFVTTNMWGLWQINKAVAQLCSGALIPLAFFPDRAQTVLSWLPFASWVATPISLFLGKVDGPGALGLFGVQLAWLGVFTVAGNLLWNKVTRRLTVQGG